MHLLQTRSLGTIIIDIILFKLPLVLFSPVSCPIHTHLSRRLRPFKQWIPNRLECSLSLFQGACLLFFAAFLTSARPSTLETSSCRQGPFKQWVPNRFECSLSALLCRLLRTLPHVSYVLLDHPNDHAPGSRRLEDSLSSSFDYTLFARSIEIIEIGGRGFTSPGQMQYIKKTSYKFNHNITTFNGVGIS